LHFVAAFSVAALIVVGAPLIAWRIGGPAERWGALINSAAVLAATAAQLVTRDARPGIPFLAADFLLATGFLVLALRYSNIWLGVAMLLQSAELTLNAVTLSAQRELTAMDALVTNLISLAVVATILCGAWTNWRRVKRNGATPAPARS
jgi:hypothetical protein